MNAVRSLPIGIESFEKIRRGGFYYVDKTSMLKDLLGNWGEVNLFTRPRRFGKSLNMNMLKTFFEYGCDPQLFDGLRISESPRLCEEYMGKFPVISISLKDVGGGDFAMARSMLCSVIGREALRFQFLSDSHALSDADKTLYRQLAMPDSTNQQGFIMPQEVLASSLLTLCSLLRKHFGQKVILLIDEYDVPLDKAQHFCYYNEMVDLIRILFSQALKSNDSLAFAVMTGCLRVSKESIFTGLNNTRIFSITDVRFDEYFGFTDREVREMLDYYDFGHRFDMVKEWYDGYRFGNTHVYCPWDVLNYVDLLRAEPEALPAPFWLNTSGNEIIRSFMHMAKAGTRKELECLIAGETICKKINQELTYRDLYTSVDNLWSVLFTTGYLTQRGRTDDGIYQLAIPNLEIRRIFIDQILEWFQLEARKDAPRLDAFCDAFARGDAKAAEAQFSAYLSKTISIRDTNARRTQKENFYHGILLGLLSRREDWYIRSNAESGDGYSDIIIEIEDGSIGIVIELKYSEKEVLDKSCEEALLQIDQLGYSQKLRQEGLETILKYGIACNRKKCRIKLRRE